MSEIININLIDILHKTGNLKIKHFYKTFKDITNIWINQNNIKGYCKYINKTNNLCLTKINENKTYCEKHSKLLWKNEAKLFNKLTLDILIEKRIKIKPLGISRSIDITENDIIYETEEKIPELIFLEPKNNGQEIEPSCPNYDDIYPPQKPDETINPKINIQDKIEVSKKKKKNKNKNKNKKPIKLITLQDFQEIDNKISSDSSTPGFKLINKYEGINKIKLYNNLLVNKGFDNIISFINEYQFLNPVDKNNNVISLTEYKNRLLSIDYNTLGFNNTKKLTYLENIIKFELTCYNKILLNKSYISNNSHNFIKSILNKIPK